MRIRIIYVLIVIIYFTTGTGLAQNNPEVNVVSPNIPNLNIGDRMPNLEMTSLINCNEKSVRLADFNDRLLLIDFWSVNCAGCVEALPRMDSLQKQFGNKIKILPVTYERESMVSAFWKGNRYTKKLKLPSIVEDKVLISYFKHNIIPHEIWIYKGKVIAITGSNYVDANNIQKILNGDNINWPVKNDFYMFDGMKEPLFKLDTDQVNPGSIIKYAALSDYKEGVNAQGFSGGSGIVRDPIRKTIRAFFLNQPIFTSYILNFNAGHLQPGKLIKPTSQFLIGANEIIWDVIDRSKYTYISKVVSGYEQDYVRKNAICFESLNPDTGQTDQQVYKSINDDLNRLLGLKVGWEKRKEKVLILVKTAQSDKLKSKAKIVDTWADHESGIDPHVNVKGSVHRFRDVSLDFILTNMNAQEANPYIFNETGFKEHVDIDLNFSSWTDINVIRKSLLTYGLDLKEEEREVDKFVFAEIGGGLLIDPVMAETAKAKRVAQKNMTNPEFSANRIFLDSNKNEPSVITLPSGLQYKILRKGTGIKPSLNDKVSVQFTGTLVNGKIFDSSLEMGMPFTTRVADVIPGWIEALQLMPTGSKWIIYVPSKLAYGPHTNQGTIPPNSTLIFEIELLKVTK